MGLAGILYNSLWVNLEVLSKNQITGLVNGHKLLFFSH